jgi:hypothetical protein
MTNPQQPEIRRSGRGEIVQDAVKTRRAGPTDDDGEPGTVPEENQPGHHPEVDQDKPTDVRDAYRAPEPE